MTREGMTAVRPAAIVAALFSAALLTACDQGGVLGVGGGVDAAGPQPVDIEKELAALGPPADDTVKAQYQGSFEAVGSEPFWRLDLLDDWVSFTRPGLQEAGGMPARRDYRAQGARIVAGPLVITLKMQACEHESGETLPYTAKVDYEGVSYDGCARRGSSGASTANWASRLGDMLPAIDRCLARIDNKPGRVSIGYIVDGKATVRLTDAQGGRYECIAPAAGGVIEEWGAISDRDVLQGENDPIFSRAPTPAPQRACATSVEAKDAAGAVVGWLTDPC